MDPTSEDISANIALARTPPEDAGRVAALETVRLPDRTRGYLPFSYLVAADDGQTGEPRPIPDDLWGEALKRADIDAAFSVSVAAYERHNTAAAVRASKQAATAGHTKAMVNLGVLLAEQVYPPKPEAARHWYEKAASAGDTWAMFNLGVLLAKGGNPPDLEQARRWYEQAATAGHTGAAFNLGFLLAERTDPPDLEPTGHWYEQAAAAGHTGAMNGLGNLLAERVDPPDLTEARRWYEQAAAAGHTGAAFNLGSLLAERTDPPDLEQARRWYEQAASAELTDAMFNLGVLLVNRIHQQELGEARRWYEQAAAAGHIGAMLNLGALLAARIDPPEPKKARAAWQKVINSRASSDDRAALASAALALATLDALAGDMTRAAELLDLAEQHGVQSAIVYKKSLSSDPMVRSAAVQKLCDSPNDSDALNFLGIASHRAGEHAMALQYWLRSAELGDTVAPLLLYITRNPTLPGRP
jgi:TPR repeat protein